ncbi:MAG: 2-oxo acid dehydrogenase subunit E2 [Akkermansiaceae bacterium]|jgi:pyruvate dehydrogenase E2 component (dihydrolipoamide acetyltransferase)|nr:2-oxo acid dehydrogenase subunit E2 [Akkermansiaceae bacterium]
MPINIDMPKLSDTMTEGTLIKWHKKVGDTVEIGDVLAEIETDKATMEMEAFDEGTLTAILVQEGQKALIGSVLAVLDGPGGGAAPAPAAAPATAPPPPPAVAPAGPAAAVVAPPAAAVPPASVVSDERLKVSPLARKLAAELGVNLATVAGTGPGGRIVKEDVENAARSAAPAVAAPVSSEAAAASALAAAAKARAAQTPPPRPAAAPAPAQPQAILPVVGEQDEVIPLTTLRRVIASRLSASKQTIPHFYLHLEVDAEPVSKLRQLINEQTALTHNNKYSLNDFILLAMVHAVKTVPAVNASFAGDAIVRFRQVGLAVAIAVEDGLVTPVIKQADTKSLLEISREVKELAARAKERKLRPDEFDGGTITVSSLGAWGIESFDAIINPPQAAILSVGAAVAKPVVKDGQVVPGLRMDIGLSCDHRVIDGALGAQFLAEVKRLIEQPALML